MSVEEFPIVALTTVSGTGPYTVPFSFSDPSHVALRVINAEGVAELVDPGDWTLTPTGAVPGGWTAGDITLTTLAAASLASRQITPERVSNPEQGWVANATPRETALANQLDWMVRAEQENARQAARSLRFVTPVDPIQPLPGAALVFDANGQPIASLNTQTATDAATATAQAGLSAGSAAAAAASAAAAAADRALAQAAAQAAAVGAALYVSVAAGEADTVNGDLFYVAVLGGVKIYLNTSGTGVFQSWLHPPTFADADALFASTDTEYDVGDRAYAGPWQYEVVASGEDRQTAGGVRLNTLPAADGALHLLALGSPTGTDDTARLAALVLRAANGRLVVDYHVAGWDHGNIVVTEDNMHILIQPGTVCRGISGSSRIWQFQSSNVVFEGYGATLQRHVGQTSHVVYISSSYLNVLKNVRVRGLTIIGNGAAGTGGSGENDCIYVGGNPVGYGGDPGLIGLPEDVIIEDCTCLYPRRNCISIIVGKSITVRNCTLDGTGAVVLRCGIDIEANKYMPDGSSAVSNIWLQNNIIRNCDSYGIINGFGDDVHIEGNWIECTSPDATGIGGGAGGAQFNDDVFRPGDRLGITNFDLATGEITVLTSGTLQDFGIHVGTWVQGVIKISSGGAFPAGMVSPFRYTISRISADGQKLWLSTHDGFGEITSFGGAHTGTLDNDPVVSHLGFYVFRQGQNSRVRVRNNTITYNGIAGAFTAINLSTFYDWTFEGNIVNMGLATGSQIQAAYGWGVKIAGGEGTGGIRGLTGGQTSALVVENYTIRKSTLDGLLIGGACQIRNVKFIGCSGELVDATGCSGAVFEGLRNIWGNVSTTGGIKINSGTRPVVLDCDMTNAGSTDANSVNMNAACVEPIVLRTRNRSGNIYGRGSLTYDPVSLADGAGVTATVTCTGAALGMFATASFSLALQGITLTAWVSASNAVQVRFQNETGGTIDLASGTLVAQAAW